LWASFGVAPMNKLGFPYVVFMGAEELSTILLHFPFSPYPTISFISKPPAVGPTHGRRLDPEFGGTERISRTTFSNDLFRKKFTF